MNRNLSSTEQSAIVRLSAGARILRTYFNETSLQKWVDLGIAKWETKAQTAVVTNRGARP